MNSWIMAIPLSVDAPDRTRTYWNTMRKKLSRMGCNRVFLTVLGRGAAAPADYFRTLVAPIRELQQFFLDAGIEPGIWVGHTIGHAGSALPGDDLFSPVVAADAQGKLHPQKGCFCPLDEAFQNYLAEVLATLAEAHPPLMMFDDDFRLGNHGADFGCFCPLHMERFRKRSKFDLSAEELAVRVRTELPLRRLWCENNRDSLYEIARKMEHAVHGVSPETRLGLATAAMLRCGDGVDLYELIQILNGNSTRPFVRTGGAPYWSRTPEHPGWLIEYARIQRQWLRRGNSGSDGNGNGSCNGGSDDEIEVFAEGDTFPHTTFSTAAASLEAFDEGLTASGFPGILSYQFCYNAPRVTDPAFERTTVANRKFHRALRKISPPEWEEIGFEPAASQAGFLARNPELTAWGSFYEGIPALRVLPRLGVPCAFGNRAMPVVLAGEECAAFSDAELEALLERGAVLDAPAAEVLLSRNFELGIKNLRRLKNPVCCERFADGTIIHHLCGSENVLWHYEPETDAQTAVLSFFGADAGHPGVARIRSRNKRYRIVFFPWSMERGGGLNFCFRRQRQWHDAFTFLTGTALPVFATGKADLRLHCRRSPDGRELAVTLQNLSLDPILPGTLKLKISPRYRPVAQLPPGAEAPRKTGKTIPDFPILPMQTCVICYRKTRE